MQNNRIVPAHERLRVALCLTFVGGFLEIYTYQLHGQVFANAQTGNLALLALNAMQGKARAWYYLVPIGAFLAGVIVSEWLRSVLSARQWATWHHFLVLAEAALMVVVAFLPAATSDAVVNVTVSFICSLQYNGFRRTHGLAYATTFCTGNLRSAGEALYHALARHSRDSLIAAGRYGLVLFTFTAGCCAAYPLAQQFGGRSILVCAGLLLLAFGMMRRLGGWEKKN